MFEGRPSGRSENPFCAPAKRQRTRVYALSQRLASPSKPRIMATPHSLARVRISGWSRRPGLRHVLRKEKGKTRIREQAVATLRRHFDVISPGDASGAAWGPLSEIHERSNDFWHECGTVSADNFVSGWRTPPEGGPEARN